MAIEVAQPTAVQPYRFTIDEYIRMGEAGIFHEDSRVELIEGEIIQMAAIGGNHVGCVNALNALLVPRLIGLATVSIQNPVRLSNRSEPLPDVALLRPDMPRNAVPATTDVLLLIEVADSTLLWDRSRKMPLYAASAIHEAWLVNLVGELIERHTEPRDGIFRQVTTYRRDDTITSTELPALSLLVDKVLG